MSVSICKSTNVQLLKQQGPPICLSPFQIVNGYFVHFFAPQGLPVVPKNVVFVIDVSGSMQGRKLEQVLSSEQVGLRNLGERFPCPVDKADISSERGGRGTG